MEEEGGKVKGWRKEVEQNRRRDGEGGEEGKRRIRGKINIGEATALTFK